MYPVSMSVEAIIRAENLMGYDEAGIKPGV